METAIYGSAKSVYVVLKAAQKFIIDLCLPASLDLEACSVTLSPSVHNLGMTLDQFSLILPTYY